MADSYRTLPLTRGHFALLDPEDYDRAAQYKWCALSVNGKLYAQRWVSPGKAEYLHRFIADAPSNRVARPINGDALDCRKSNLRIARTRAECEEARRRPRVIRGRDIQRKNRHQRDLSQFRRQQWLAENGPCALCGSAKRLEVDHIDPELKVSHRVWSWAEERRIAELDKCRVLCHECHKERHKADHGTITRYRYHRCRCKACRAANATQKARERIARQ